MNNKSKKILSILSIVTGAALIIAAAGLLFFNMRGYIIDTAKAVSQIEQLLPKIVECVPQEKGNNDMPSMEVADESYVALVEMEMFRFKMPVRSVWDEKAVEAVPCRYSGSVYDNTLVIATTDDKGQMDFVNNINTGDRIAVTTMRGEQFSYKVVKIENSNTATPEELNSNEFDLTIFVEYSGPTDYLFIRCESDFVGIPKQ